MLGVTLFGLILTPVAYYLVRRWRTPSVASVTRRAVPQLCRLRRRWALGGGWKGASVAGVMKSGAVRYRVEGRHGAGCRRSAKCPTTRTPPGPPTPTTPIVAPAVSAARPAAAAAAAAAAPARSDRIAAPAVEPSAPTPLNGSTVAQLGPPSFARVRIQRELRRESGRARLLQSQHAEPRHQSQSRDVDADRVRRAEGVI